MEHRASINNFDAVQHVRMMPEHQRRAFVNHPVGHARLPGIVLFDILAAAVHGGYDQVAALRFQVLKGFAQIGLAGLPEADVGAGKANLDAVLFIYPGAGNQIGGAKPGNALGLQRLYSVERPCSIVLMWLLAWLPSTLPKSIFA